MNKIEIKLKSFDTNFINSTVESIENIVTKLGLGDIKQVFLKCKCKKWTLIRSPHIDKKSREQFEIKTYKRFLILKITQKNRIFFFFLILKNAFFSGLELEITLHSTTSLVS